MHDDLCPDCGLPRAENPTYRRAGEGVLPSVGTRVQCYRNLHIEGVGWSVREAKARGGSGLVVAIASEVVLSDVTLRVSEAGRQRVIAEKRKNVHAWVDGYWESEVPEGLVWEGITYNPYRFGSFVLRADETPVHHAAFIRLGSDGKMTGVIDGARGENPTGPRVGQDMVTWVKTPGSVAQIAAKSAIYAVSDDKRFIVWVYRRMAGQPGYRSYQHWFEVTDYGTPDPERDVNHTSVPLRLPGLAKVFPQVEAWLAAHPKDHRCRHELCSHESNGDWVCVDCGTVAEKGGS